MPYAPPASLARHRNIVSVSGGKDSTALYLWAIETAQPFRAVWADTGHEHPATVEYVGALAERCGGPPVQTVRADLSGKFPARREAIARDWPEQGVPAERVARALAVMHSTGNPFLDSCLLRAGFPSPNARFCTDVLKIRPILADCYRPVWASGRAVISWQGVRRDESLARRDLTRYQRLEYGRNAGKAWAYRPLLDWTLDDVWARHRRHGIEPNPLYRAGASRVGCMPCIYARKAELHIISERWPAEVDRVREWEQLVTEASKQGMATLFPAKHLQVPGPVRTETHGIDAAMDWAATSRGGKQRLLFGAVPERQAMLAQDMAESCSTWGGCE